MHHAPACQLMQPAAGGVGTQETRQDSGLGQGQESGLESQDKMRQRSQDNRHHNMCPTSQPVPYAACAASTAPIGKEDR